MKLGSLKHGRDGRLVVVSDDLSRARAVPEIAGTLQQALDRWEDVEGDLRAVAVALADGGGEIDFAAALSAGEVASPLPRAYQWADGSAYVNHVALVRKARGAELPESFWNEPLMYQGDSGRFLGPRDPIEALDEAHGIDFEAEVAVVTDDVPMDVPADRAARHVKLVMLVNDVSLRALIPAELAKGFGFFHGKPASSFSPVAATPDALGEAWRDGKLHRPLLSTLNGKPFGRPEAGTDMTFDFGRLIAHAAATRHLPAGSIIGSGTVSNRGADGGPGRTVAEGGAGYSCIAEIRMIETIARGEPTTPFMGFGDAIRIEMLDESGRDIFGAIDQRVERATLQGR